jgi:hypothetical protein
MMQIVMAQAMIPTGADWSRMLRRLRVRKKVPVDKLRKMNIATNTATKP